LSVLKTVIKGLEDFRDKFEAWKTAFSCSLLESFENFMADPYYEPLLWFIPEDQGKTMEKLWTILMAYIGQH